MTLVCLPGLSLTTILCTVHAYIDSLTTISPPYPAVPPYSDHWVAGSNPTRDMCPSHYPLSLLVSVYHEQGAHGDIEHMEG